jgi:hypothetical protein
MSVVVLVQICWFIFVSTEVSLYPCCYSWVNTGSLEIGALLGPSIISPIFFSPH